jgi:hypothetical protein
MIKRPLLFMLLLAATMVLTYQASATENPQLRKILKAHADAMGGWKNWSQIESIRQTGNIERDGQTIEFCIVKKRPHQIRATITIPIPGSDNEAMQMIQAHDGKQAWSATRRAGGQELNQQKLTGQAAADLLAEATVLPSLIHLWRSGATLDRLPNSTQAGQEQIVIQATPTDTSSVYTFYLHSENFRVLHYTQLNTDGTNIQTTLNHYRTFNGLLFPETTRIESKQTGISSMVTHDIEIGIGIYDDYFENIHRATPNLLSQMH